MSQTGELKLEKQLGEHLNYNMFPVGPKPFLVDPCKQAIFAVKDDEPEKLIQVGDSKIEAGELVEDLYLDWFLEQY